MTARDQNTPARAAARADVLRRSNELRLRDLVGRLERAQLHVRPAEAARLRSELEQLKADVAARRRETGDGS